MSARVLARDTSLSSLVLDMASTVAECTQIFLHDADAAIDAKLLAWSIARLRVPWALESSIASSVVVERTRALAAESAEATRVIILVWKPLYRLPL